MSACGQSSTLPHGTMQVSRHWFAVQHSAPSMSSQSRDSSHASPSPGLPPPLPPPSLVLLLVDDPCDVPVDVSLASPHVVLTDAPVVVSTTASVVPFVVASLPVPSP